jgi:hypothetical protein
MRKYIIANLKKGAVNILPGQVVEVGGKANPSTIPDNGIKVIRLTESVTLSQIHNNAVLLVEGFVTITIPTNLAQAFVTCLIDVKSGQCTIAQNSGVTITGNNSLVLGVNDKSSLYKENIDENKFRLI